MYRVDAEKVNNWLREQVGMGTLEDLQKELTKEEYDEISGQIQQYKDTYGVRKIKGYFSSLRKMTKFIKKATFNGWLLPADKKVVALSPIDPPFDAFRRNRIVLFEAFSGKCRLAKREYSKLVSAACTYISIGLMNGKLVKAEKAYREGVEKITKMEAWKRYLSRKNESTER